MSGVQPTVPAASSGRRPSLRLRRDEPLPMALLEFHSPSAAIAAMPPTPAARYITWIISSMALAGVGAMAFFPIDRVVTASGALVPTVPMIVVQPLETARIRSIDVHEGDIVRKGQQLAELDPTLTNADVSNLSQQSASLQAEVNRLTAEVSGRSYAVNPADPASTQQAAIFLRREAEHDAKLQNYDQQIASLRSDMVGFEANAAMFGGRVKVASDVRAMRVELQRDQVGSRLNSLAAQDNLMEVERSQISAQQSAAGARAKLAAMVAERAGYIESDKADTYQSLTEAERKLYDASGQLTKADLQKSLMVMRADQDAVVLNIAHVSSGSVITAAQQFMTLAPLDAKLEVEARMPADEAGYVKLGDKAQVKFQTFTYLQHGGADAVVTDISADSFSQDQVQATAASAPANGLATPDGTHAFFRVRLRIDRYTLHDVPRAFVPNSGTVVAADINVGRRTVLQFLLSTVIPTVTEGMRDPS